MPEKYHYIGKPESFFQMPVPERGILQERSQIASFFQIRPLEVVKRGPEPEHPRWGDVVEVGPTLDFAAITLLNRRVMQEPDIISQHETWEALSHELPKIKIYTKHGLEFMFGGGERWRCRCGRALGESRVHGGKSGRKI